MRIRIVWHVAQTVELRKSNSHCPRNLTRHWNNLPTFIRNSYLNLLINIKSNEEEKRNGNSQARFAIADKSANTPSILALQF